METPDQLLQRLEAMGEERVRALLARRYFESRQTPLVQGWLAKLEQARSEAEEPPAVPDAAELLQRARDLARQAEKAASAAQHRASEAATLARASQRLSLIAVTIGSIALLVSSLLLFVAANR